MKNKLNFSQIAQIYIDEIGTDIPYMEQYLRAIFANQPLGEYEERLKGVVTNSEFFPELHRGVMRQIDGGNVSK